MTKAEATILQHLVGEALRLGGDALDIDHKAGYEEICVMRGAVGWGIARYRSSSPDAIALREELYALTRKRRRVIIGSDPYVLVGNKRDSFGETAFRVEIRLAHPARRRCHSSGVPGSSGFR